MNVDMQLKVITRSLESLGEAFTAHHQRLQNLEEGFAALVICLNTLRDSVGKQLDIFDLARQRH